MSLEEQVKELRRMVEELAKEVRGLKARVEAGGEVREVVKEIEVPDYVQAVYRVFEERLRDRPNAGIVFVGGLEKREGKIVDSFFSGVDLEDVRKVSSSRIVRILGSLANEHRVKILLSLLQGSKSASELAEETGLEGGPLYHHLKELMLAGYIESPERGKYVLTPRGCIVIRVVAALASIPGITPPQIEDSQ